MPTLNVEHLADFLRAVTRHVLALSSLARRVRRLEEGAQLKAGEVEKVVEARVRALKGDYDKQLSVATRNSPANSSNPRTLRSPPCKTSSARLPDALIGEDVGSLGNNTTWFDKNDEDENVEIASGLHKHQEL